MSSTNCSLFHLHLPRQQCQLLRGMDARMPLVNCNLLHIAVSVWDATGAYAEALQCVWRFAQQDGPPQAENLEILRFKYEDFTRF